jgi:tetratricopeptide (TPR) repeat protein
LNEIAIFDPKQINIDYNNINQNYTIKEVHPLVEKCIKNNNLYQEIDKLIKLHKFPNAIEVCKNYKLHDNLNGYIDSIIGDCFLNLKEYSLAIEYYESSLRQSPHDFEVLSQIGLCYLFLGEINIGENKVHFAFKKNNKNAVCWKNMGVLHICKDRLKDALKCFEHSKELKRDVLMIDFYLAYVHIKLENKEKFNLYKLKFEKKNEVNYSIFDF